MYILYTIKKQFQIGVIHKRRRPIFPILWPPSLPLWGDVVYGCPLCIQWIMQNFRDHKTISGLFFCNKMFITRKQSILKIPPIKRDSRKPAPYIQIHCKAVRKGGGGGDCIPAFDSSVNPNSLRGQIMPTTLLLPPRIFRCSYSPALKDVYRIWGFKELFNVCGLNESRNKSTK